MSCARLAVLALHVLGGLAVPTGEEAAGLAPAADRKIKKLFDRRPGSPTENSTVAKDENGIVLCPLQVDTCVAAAKAQKEGLQKIQDLKKDFKRAKRMFKDAKKGMRHAKYKFDQATEACPGGCPERKSAGKLMKHQGKRMTFWGNQMSELGTALGTAQYDYGDLNRVANLEGTNEERTKNKEIRDVNRKEREAKKAASVAAHEAEKKANEEANHDPASTD